MFATPGQGAEGEESEPERWLPARLEESLAIHLEAIIEHASTRRACNTILEAKYSDGSSELNPKFIVTCESEEYGSTNLVYWQTDVEQNFANVLYEAKDDPHADEQQINEIDLPSPNPSSRTCCLPANKPSPTTIETIFPVSARPGLK